MITAPAAVTPTAIAPKASLEALAPDETLLRDFSPLVPKLFSFPLASFIPVESTVSLSLATSSIIKAIKLDLVYKSNGFNFKVA